MKDYLKKTGFSYELLTRFLEAVPDLANLGKLDLVDGFFAVRVKKSQRTYMGFSLFNPDTKETDYYEFHVLRAPRYLNGSIHFFQIYFSHYRLPPTHH